MNDNWVKLKEYILTKNSHGKNELLQKMVELEINSVEDKTHQLQSELKEAVGLLREGRMKFTPNTTNPLVDDFLERHNGL